MGLQGRADLSQSQRLGRLVATMTRLTSSPTPYPVSDADTDTFVALRPRLFGMAYRMLGTRADADDVLQ